MTLSYEEKEARRMQSIVAVQNLIRAVEEKSQIYGLNDEELDAINSLQKQVADEARCRLEAIFDTFEGARKRRQVKQVVKHAVRPCSEAYSKWRKSRGGHPWKFSDQRNTASDQVSNDALFQEFLLWQARQRTLDPLDETGRDVLFREFLLWQLCQRSAEP